MASVPYAAPAGVAPVELSIPKPVSKPLVINNPHFKGNGSVDAKIKSDTKVKTEATTDTKVKTEAKPKKNKVAGWQINPFFDPQLAVK